MRVRSNRGFWKTVSASGLLGSRRVAMWVSQPGVVCPGEMRMSCFGVRGWKIGVVRVDILRFLGGLVGGGEWGVVMGGDGGS